MTVTHNYLDGSGITRSWSTSGIFAQGNVRVTIANNEVTRTAGNGIFIKGESLSKGALSDQVRLKPDDSTFGLLMSPSSLILGEQCQC